jgi:hypothetical protein
MNKNEKYRVWDKKRNQYMSAEMLKQVFLHCDGSVFWQPFGHNEKMSDITNEVEIEFFIGLCDVDGNELYKNHIVKDTHGRTMQIVWCENVDDMDRSHLARWEFKLLDIERDWTSNFEYADLHSWFVHKNSSVKIIGTSHDREPDDLLSFRVKQKKNESAEKK